MFDQPWRQFASCRGFNHDTWYPEPTDHVTAKKAKAICRVCPSTASCLDHAVLQNEPGIWGGTAEEKRRRLRRDWNKIEAGMSPNPPAGSWSGGIPRWDRLVDVTVKGIRLGIDLDVLTEQNTPGATCGHISTWNRSCRCDSCHAASTMRAYLRKVLPANEYAELCEEDVAALVGDYEARPQPTDWDAEVALLEEMAAA